MKIYNRKALDSYSFETIMIRDDKKRIDIKGKCNYPTIEVGEVFSKKIKGMDDTDQVNGIIDYYLECSSVDVVTDTMYFSHYSEKFFACQGNGRLLAFQLPSIPEYRKIPRKIYDNFCLSREEFIDKNPNSMYRIVLTDGVGKYYNDYGQISMRLISRCGRILPPEEEFLKKFMNKKIEEGGGLMIPYIVDESDRFGLNKRKNVYISDGTLISFGDNKKVLKLEGF